jgi:hypothetical protein
LSALDIERTKFTERIFAVFDAKHDGRIDFREFVLSLWNYCTLGKASLSKLFESIARPVGLCSRSHTNAVLFDLSCTCTHVHDLLYLHIRLFSLFPSATQTTSRSICTIGTRVGTCPRTRSTA